MSQARHLVSLWNPAYADGAMDAHLRVLLDWIERHRDGKADEDDVYVWWARIRSANRQQGLPHDADVLTLDEQVQRGVDTHLYLTDYRSLYVGHLGEITADAVLEDEAEWPHAPEYYRYQMVDFWFRLWDLRLLVADDTLETIELLKGLRNLPLVVTEGPARAWFSDVGLLTGDRRWVERDADLRGETARLARDLRDNVLSRAVWAALEPSTRTFLASAEAVFRARREDPAFDFSGPAVEYAKAVEVELNALIFPVLRRALARGSVAARTVRLAERPTDLGAAVPHQTLGALRVLLEHEDVVIRALRSALAHDGSWLVGEVPCRLRALEDLRNPAAHSETAWRDQVSFAREEIVGIGQEGLIGRVARAKMRARL
jgi:hypothetical protein